MTIQELRKRMMEQRRREMLRAIQPEPAKAPSLRMVAVVIFLVLLTKSLVLMWR